MNFGDRTAGEEILNDGVEDLWVSPTLVRFWKSLIHHWKDRIRKAVCINNGTTGVESSLEESIKCFTCSYTSVLYFIFETLFWD
jgi:hypothetical protein